VFFTIFFAFLGVFAVLHALRQVGVVMDDFRNRTKAAAMRHLLKKTRAAADRNKDRRYEKKHSHSAVTKSVESVKKLTADTERQLSRMVLGWIQLSQWVEQKALRMDQWFVDKWGEAYAEPRTFVVNAVSVTVTVSRGERGE
jgi:hypothetical protein